MKYRIARLLGLLIVLGVLTGCGNSSSGGGSSGGGQTGTPCVLGVGQLDSCTLD